MPLKFVIDRLDEVAGPLQEHYAKMDDGKYQLATTGEHPKVAEFRSSNVELLKERDALKTKFDGVDPDEYRTLKAKAAAGDPPDVVALRAELATERAARLEVQQRADALVIDSAVSDAFLRAGGLPKARGFIIGLAKDRFTVENGQPKGKTFSPVHPGQPLSVDEFVALQTRENSYLFAPSSGGGAEPKRGGGSSTVKELRDPSPQDLGRYATEIAAGRVRVVYSA